MNIIHTGVICNPEARRVPARGPVIGAQKWGYNWRRGLYGREKKIEETEKYIQLIRTKLDNPRFIENAPEELVSDERSKLLDLEALLKTHQEHLALFQK